MRYFGLLTKRYYENEIERDHFESREAQRRMVPSDEELAIEQMPLEQLRELCKRREDANQAAQNDVKEGEVGAVFMRLHPEILRSDENSKQFVDYFRKRGLVADSVERMEIAYAELNAAGLVQLNAKVLAKQREQELDRKAREIAERRAPTEDDAYSMPIDNLRSLANRSLSLLSKR